MRSRETVTALQAETDVNTDVFVEGVVVQHDKYGMGQITEASGYGALRKVRVRFATAGLRTFMAARAKLEIVQADLE
jgi:DNA helicase-2/ATP-dependent DNA helicase PcrA